MNRDLLHDSIVRSVWFEMSRSGGPGGQNVNKVETRVRAGIPVNSVEGLTELEHAQLIRRADKKNNVSVSVTNTRSQEQNRAIALSRLESFIVSSSRVRKRRIKTKPTYASRERRLASKKLQSNKKRARKSECLPFD